MDRPRRFLLPRTLAALFAVALLLVSVSTALAAKTPVGDRINLFFGDQTYPAETAFHVMHGFGFEDGDLAIGKGRFNLDVDGVAQHADFVTTFTDNGSVVRFWVFNYPDGMTGTHTFTGHWYVPCISGENCGNLPPNTLVEFSTIEITVEFI